MDTYTESDLNEVLALLNRRDERRAYREVKKLLNPEAFAAAARESYLRRRERILAQKRFFRAKQKIFCPWIPLIHGARTRAKRKGLQFNLTNRWAEVRWTGRCEWTGIPFDLNPEGPGSRLLSPSVDRLVPKRGYTKDNCRIILFGVNSLKWDGTDADAVRIALAIVARGLGQACDTSALMDLLTPQSGPKAKDQALEAGRPSDSIKLSSSILSRKFH